MTCVTQIAKELYEELNEPDDLSVSAIAYWLRSNLGKLNNKLCASFDIDCDLNVTPDMSLGEADIFKTLYAIYYFGKKATDNLGVAAVDTIIEIDSDGSRVRRYNRNELAKTYINLKNTANEDLKSLINGYKYCRASNAVSAVHGEDALYTSCPYSWRAELRNVIAT